MTTFRIQGTVVDQDTQLGVPALRVEAWDKDLIFDDLVGSTETNNEGKFTIEFNESYFQELFSDRQPDLFFKVFSAGKLIASTEETVLWNASAGNLPVSIEVNVDTAIRTSGTVLVTSESILFTLTDEQQAKLQECVKKGTLNVSFDSKPLTRIPNFLENGVLID